MYNVLYPAFTSSISFVYTYQNTLNIDIAIVIMYNVLYPVFTSWTCFEYTYQNTLIIAIL